MTNINSSYHTKCWQRCGKLELSYLVVGMQNGTATMENSFILFKIVQPRPTLYPRRSLPKRNKKTCLCRHPCTAIHSNFVCNNPKLEKNKIK